MEQLLQDVRYGIRSFLRQPGFTATAILALALGIGANTAVFSVVNGVLLEPLPMPEPGQLVFIEDTYAQVPNAAVSVPKLRALKESARTLAAVGGYTPSPLTLTGDREPEQVQGVSVTADVFRAMAVPPLLGRWFTDEEDTANGPPAIILNETLWQRRYGGARDIVGKTIQVNGVAREVVGVMPRTTVPAAQAWVPLAAPATAGQGNFLRLLGRMAPEATLDSTRQELTAITEAYNAQNGLQRNTAVFPLKQIIVGRNERILLILQGVVVFVLLIACANVANLLLARSVARQRELAIRAAMGAGRARLVRQMLTESGMLSIAGGIVGILLGSWLLRFFLSVVPPSFPRISAISLDARVLVFTVLIAIVTGLLFGLAPARQGFRTNPNDSLREAGTKGATSGAGRGASRALVIAETALALVLVIGAGLLVKSLLRLQSQQTGFSAEQVFTFNLNLPPAKYPAPAPRDFYARLIGEVRAIPGVESAAAINYAPMTQYGFNGPFSVQGQPAFEKGREPITEYRWVTPGYFETMRIPLLRGQDIDHTHTGADRPVVIINESMAKKYFGSADPIGSRIWLAVDPRTVFREVIGVVADVRDATPGRPPSNETFIPHAQQPRGGMAIMVRTAAGTGMDRVLPAVRQRLAALDPDVPVVQPQTMEAAIDATTRQERMTSSLTSVFALVAALLATVGIYSLISYSVAQRTREIGIRVALGANRRTVLRLVITEGVTLALAGVALGVPGAFLLSRFLETLLYEVSPTDPVVLAATAVGVLLVAVCASVVPALRAIRIDPMIALRAE